MRFLSIALPVAALGLAALSPLVADASAGSELARLLRAPMARFLLNNTDEGLAFARFITGSPKAKGVTMIDFEQGLARAEHGKLAEKLEERLLRIEERLRPNGAMEVTAILKIMAKQELRTVRTAAGEVVFFEEAMSSAYARTTKAFLETGAANTLAFETRIDGLLENVATGRLARELSNLSTNGSHFFLRELEAAADKFSAMVNEAYWKGYLIEKNARFDLLSDLTEEMTEALRLMKLMKGTDAMIFAKVELPYLKKAFATIRAARARVQGVDDLGLTLEIEAISGGRYRVIVD